MFMENPLAFWQNPCSNISRICGTGLRACLPRNVLKYIEDTSLPHKPNPTKLAETDLYLSSPSDSEGLRALEINIYGCGFSYLVYYETDDLGDPCTSSVSRRGYSNFSFIKGTEQRRREHSCVCASLSP